MSDIDRVLRWSSAGTLVRPTAAEPGTVHLARALAHAAGVPRADLDFDDVTERVLALIGEAEHHVFVLVDGLGMNLVETMAAGAFVRRRLAGELRSVFPSTTAAALTSLATARWPAEHAVPGWWTYLPDEHLTATVLPFHERFSHRPLDEFGVRAEQVFPRLPWMAAASADVMSLLPAPIAASTYSRYFSGGTPCAPYESLADGVDAVRRRIAHARGPTFTYLYVPSVDEAEHHYGPHAGQVRAVLAGLDEDLGRLEDALAGRGRIVLSADHGVVHVPVAERHVLPTDDPLLELLRVPPSVEPRVPGFHVKDGQAAAFAEAFRGRLGERYALLTVDEVDELRLLGPAPLSAETRRRLGDFLALSEGPDALLSDIAADALQGFHGGLLPGEVRVPLVIA